MNVGEVSVSIHFSWCVYSVAVYFDVFYLFSQNIGELKCSLLPSAKDRMFCSSIMVDQIAPSRRLFLIICIQRC
jgi:hypothetical protein